MLASMLFEMVGARCVHVAAYRADVDYYTRLAVCHVGEDSLRHAQDGESVRLECRLDRLKGYIKKRTCKMSDELESTPCTGSSVPAQFAPALFTRISTLPSSPIIICTTFCTSSSLVTSRTSFFMLGCVRSSMPSNFRAVAYTLHPW